jgi:hypothetical protein
MAGLFDDEPPTTEFDDLLAAGAVEHKQTDNASASAISEPNLPKAQSTVSGKAHQLKARSKVEVVRCRGIKRPPQTSLDQIDYSTLLAEARAGKPAAREQTAATKISHDGPANKRRGIESHTGPRQQSQPRGKATNHASRSKAGVRRGAQAPTGKGNKNWMENRRRKQAAAGAKADGDSQPLRRGLADDDVIDRTLLVHGASDSDGSGA